MSGLFLASPEKVPIPFAIRHLINKALGRRTSLASPAVLAHNLPSDRPIAEPRETVVPRESRRLEKNWKIFTKMPLDSVT